MDTYPDELNDGAELQLLFSPRHRFNGCFDPGPTQPGHHLQKMTPIWRLNVEGHKPSGRQRDDIWDPALERRLNAGDLRWVEPECCRGKGSALRCSPIVPKDLQTPYSNCWSMNEFGVGPSAGGPVEESPEDELGYCTGDESCDSSTVGSEPDFPGTTEFGPALPEGLGTASKD